MNTFVDKNDSLLDKITDADTLMKAAPEYYGPRFEAIAELRAIDDGTLHRGNEFRRVASLVNVPLMNAMRMCEPGFFKDKKAFYAWLSRNPQYRTYDKRGGSRPAQTYVDGKPVQNG